MLREAVAPLDVEDILGLCYAFAADPLRLKVYLDVLRGKGGQRAQAAACLICYDLARQGDPVFQAEFLSLLPVLRAHLPGEPSSVARSMDSLMGDSAYLRALWDGVKNAFLARDDRLDDRQAERALTQALDTDTLEIKLLDQEDLDEIDLGAADILDADDEAMRERWEEALDSLFPVTAQTGGMHPSIYPPGGCLEGGFRADEREDLARVERLRQSAQSLAGHVAHAHEMLPLVELFLAAHTRARNFFGRPNQARAQTLQEGLAHFADLPHPPAEAACWMVPPYAPDTTWPKVAELLLDYVAFLGSTGRGAAPRPATSEALAQAYATSKRPQPPPTRLAPSGRERRRR
jgi:hypothetical protein